MKWSEFRRLAEKQGWYLDRHGKEHDIYRHKEIEGRLVIGRHSSEEIAKGTLGTLKKKMMGG